MFGKTILLSAFAVSILFSIGFRVSAQIPQAGGGGNPRREMSLPKLKFPAGKSSVEVPFEIEGNWMVIPVSVNGSRPLRFVLDTGAQGTFLQNSRLADSLNLKIVGKMQIRGAGGSGGEASVAENVTFNIGGIELSNGRLVIPPPLPSSPNMKSMPAHDGVIGRIVFATLVVEADWEKKTLKFYEPSKYKYTGAGTVLPLTIDEGGRPYTTASVAVAANDKPIPVKLVVDTGGSHSLWLDVGSKPEIKLPEGATKTVLGRGAGGEFTGYAGRVKSFEFGGQKFSNVPTIFPDQSAGTAGTGGRQGNLGSGFLRRFKIIYDYSRKQMIVEPNKFAGEPFGTPMQRDVQTNTAQVSPAALQDYAGKYGNKEISVKDGGLYYQRIGGRGALLRATGKDKFALNADAQITFVRDGKGAVSEMLIEWVDRDKEQLKRELPANNQPNNQPNNQSQVQQQLSEAEREVRKLEREWLDAYEKYDAEAMNRIVSDDFKLTFPDGSVQTKADVLAQLKSARDANRPSPKFSTEDVQSRVEGETVILTGRVIQQMTRDGQTRMMQMRYTDTYAKRGGRWQVVASQLTRIQPQ